jgi:hypothetical protein
MAERQKGLNFQLDRLKALARDAGITIGSKLIPKLVPLFEELAGFIDSHQGDIEKLGDEIADAARSVGEFAKSIDWDTVGASLKLAGAGARAVASAFFSLPAWVQTAVLTGWGLNKFTGGALGGIVGELAKGMIKGVLGINAGIVNVNGPVAGGGAGAGGGGSLLSGPLAAALIGLTATVVAVHESWKGIEEFGAKNTEMGDKGLTEAEIIAVKYYQSDTAAQQNAYKRLGYLPSKQDYDSGINKLTATDRQLDGAAHRRSEAVKRSTIESGLKAQRAGDKVAQTVRNKDLSVSVDARTSINLNASWSIAGLKGRWRAQDKVGYKGTSRTGLGTLGNGGR